MKRPFTLFSPAFSLVYAVLYCEHFPIFIYYPLNQELALRALPPSHGPGMLWFGWVAAGLLAGVVTVWLVPIRWAARVPAWSSWCVMIAVMALVVFKEHHWFIP